MRTLLACSLVVAGCSTDFLLRKYSGRLVGCQAEESSVRVVRWTGTRPLAWDLACHGQTWRCDTTRWGRHIICR